MRMRRDKADKEEGHEEQEEHVMHEE